MPERTQTEQEDRDRTDALTDLIRTGAQQLIAQALKAEVADLMATYTEQRDDQGRAGVVRNGSHPARDIQTGIGPVTVRVPKVRSRQGEPVTFHSALVPPYVRKTASLEAAIPWLYLKGISTGMCNAHSKRWKEREGFSREVVFFHCHPGSNDLMPG